MNKIILPPTILSALLPNHTRIQGNNDQIYLVRESYRPQRTTISALYQLFFGSRYMPASIQPKKESGDGSPEYFSNYE
jgi:hypothetical protein